MQNIAELIIRPILLIITSIIVIFSVSLALSLVLGFRAIILLIFLAASFYLLSSLVVPTLRISSLQNVRLNAKISSLLNQILFSIRDIHLTQSRDYFESKFVRIGKSAQRFQWRAKLLPDVPRIVIEPLAITCILLVALLPYLYGSDYQKLASNLIPFVATFIVSLVKLTPPLQDLFRSITTVRGGLPEIDAALLYLELPDSNRGFPLS